MDAEAAGLRLCEQGLHDVPRPVGEQSLGHVLLGQVRTMSASVERHSFVT
jgi:hypothetical protein